MATIWADRKEHAGSSARQARNAYQRKEAELESARAEATRLQVELRSKKEEFTRAKRGTEKRQLEILGLEKTQRDLGRLLEDLEQRIARHKGRVSRLEHEVEQLREAAFRGRSFGV